MPIDSLYTTIAVLVVFGSFMTVLAYAAWKG